MQRDQSTLDHQRAIQRKQVRRDAAKPAAAATDATPAVPAGGRDLPVQLSPPHLAKPGLEADLALAPRFSASDYFLASPVRAGYIAGIVLPVTDTISAI